MSDFEAIEQQIADVRDTAVKYAQELDVTSYGKLLNSADTMTRLLAVARAADRLYRQCHNIKEARPRWANENVCFAMQDFGKTLTELKEGGE